MYPIIPSEILTGGWDLIVSAFALVAAVCSYLFALR
jgi:hypothetical protein